MDAIKKVKRMKSIKEKAKAYDGNYKAYTELINRLEDVKEAIKKQNYGIAIDVLCKPYPEFQITTHSELKESEDERIRKWLLELVEEVRKANSTNADYNGMCSRVIDWLEKQGEQKSIDDLTQQEVMDIAVAKCFEQGEQKPTDKVEPKFKVGDYIKPIDKCLGSSRIIEEVYDGWYVTDKGTLYFEFEDNWELVEQNPAWSEEDERHRKRIVERLEDIRKSKEDIDVASVILSEIDWLKFLKDRVQPQPKQELSEEDKRIIDNLISQLGNLFARKLIKEETKDKYVNFLKSLKDRYTWKPSVAQLNALSIVSKGYVSDDIEAIASLYNDLKKVKGE